MEPKWLPLTELGLTSTIVVSIVTQAQIHLLGSALKFSLNPSI